MTDLFAPVLALHIGVGLAATVVGLGPILTAKGSRPHRLAGRLFVLLMTVLLIAACVMTALHFTAYLLGLSATATYHVFSGVRVLGRKRPDLRAADRARPIDWLAAAGVTGVGLVVLALILTGRSDGPPAVSGGLAFAALAFGSWDLWRFARPNGWPFSPNLWTYEHLAKMLSAYSAVLSAFSGNFLTVLPAPWSQLWPSLLFPSLAATWIAILIVRRRGSTAFA
ncbi:hypothetical protein [Brevundimonas sp.]|uniref:hypothetical protein n=1 Tax=Brevundimonas sp. TaxID=1871086 RepID=UPI002FCCB45F